LPTPAQDAFIREVLGFDPAATTETAAAGAPHQADGAPGKPAAGKQPGGAAAAALLPAGGGGEAAGGGSYQPGGGGPGSGKADPAVTELQKRLPQTADGYLEMWLVAATGALQEMPPMSDQVESHNFAVALAGNLLWAASSLFPEAKIAVVACSFVGSMIGSGAEASSAPPSPLKDILTHLHQARDAVSKRVHGHAGKLAAEIVKAGKTQTEDQDKAIWGHIFPGGPFNASAALLDKARTAIARGYAAFQSDFASWIQVTTAQAKEINEKLPLPKDIDPWILAKVGAGPALDARLPSIVAKVQAKYPFKLRLTF
jgi:hypothetical protein